MRLEMSIGSITLWTLLFVMIAVAIAVLDLVRGTNYSTKLGFAPASLPVFAIGLLVIPYLTAIGNSISEFWGDVLPMGCLLFVLSAFAITKRQRRELSHNKSLNPDASKAGAG